MKKSVFTPVAIKMLVIVAICSCSVPARIPSLELANLKTMTPPNGKALVYIIRPTAYGSFFTFKLTCDDREIGSLGGKQFLYTVLEPGTHKFVGKAENKSELFLSVQADQVYYLSDQAQTGIWSAENSLTRVDVDGGMNLLKKSKLSTDCLAYKVTK